MGPSGSGGVDHATGGGAATAVWPASAFAQKPGYARTLVLVELKGGNDGLNTVVPYADFAYSRLRPRLAIQRDQVLQLDQQAMSKILGHADEILDKVRRGRVALAQTAG